MPCASWRSRGPESFTSNLHSSMTPLPRILAAVGLAKSSIVLSLILAAVFYLGRGWLQVILFYWLIVVLVRAAGTAVGDFFASKAVGLGLPLSTALTGAVLVATLMLWKERSLRHSAAPTLP